MRHRLFAGIRPPPGVRSELLGQCGGVPDARWQSDSQLHATLAFLGEVDRHQANAIAERLAAIRFAPFSCRLTGFGTFDNGRGRVTSLWVGLAPREALAGLAARVSQALVPIGIPLPARRYLPHVTLARFPARGVAPTALARFLATGAAPSCGFEVTSFSLFESHLGREGAHYVEVARYPAQVTESSGDRRRW